MLSIAKVRAAGDAVKYYEKDDYYTRDGEGKVQGEGQGGNERGEGPDGGSGLGGGNTPATLGAAEGDVRGEWGGRGAGRLGLSGPVDKADFQPVLEGRLPNGDVLGRIVDGERKHTPGWDLTFSAPKSVSLLAEVGLDHRLVEAHEKAVTAAMAWTESNAIGTRESTSVGKIFVRTENLLAARFTHHTSRNQDPALHSHVVVANATQDASGQWRSVHSIELFRSKMAIGQVYRSELAREVLALGYDIKVDEKQGTWEIPTVPDEYRTLMSSRRAQIEQKLAEWGKNGAEDAARAALVTRQRKQDTPLRDLQGKWRSVAGEMGIPVDRWVQDAEAREPQERSGVESLESAIREARAAASEKEAVFSHAELVRDIHRRTVGAYTTDQIEKAIGAKASTGELERVDEGGKRLWTTPMAKSQEARVLSSVMEARAEPLLSGRAMGRADLSALNDSQANTARLVLTTDSKHMAIVGRAGVGKTTMLKTVNDILSANRVTVKGMASNADAAKGLSTTAGIESSTIHKHLQTVSKELRERAGENRVTTFLRQITSRPEVWVVDEASQIPNNLAARLFWAAERAGARVVLVGDDRQTAAINAGKPFELLLDRGITRSEMNQILRQRNQADRETIEKHNSGNVKGALDDVRAKATEIKDKKERFSEIINRWAEGSNEQRANSLIITSNNKDRAALNAGVRNVLRSEGQLTGERTRSTLEKTFGTTAGWREAHNYSPGQVVLFASEVRGTQITRGTYVDVVDVNKEARTVTLRDQASGASVVWDPRKEAMRSRYAPVVLTPRDTTLAPGEQIRWTQNSNEFNLRNGELLKVVGVSDASTDVMTADGRMIQLPANESKGQHWTHAYAATTFSSQGRTVDRAIVNLDSKSGALLSQRAFLVGISRHRDSVEIYTDSKKDLTAHVMSTSGDKSSAVLAMERSATVDSALGREADRRAEEKAVQDRERDARASDESERQSREKNSGRELSQRIQNDRAMDR